MPVHRGPRLDDLVSRLVGIAQPIRANMYQTWPNLGIPAQLTSGSTAGVYGAWTEMVSAANAPNEPFTVAYMDFAASEGRNMVFQLGIGASGSEVPVTTFLGNAYGYANGYGTSYPTVFPYIPAGTRVALRMRSDYNNGVGASAISTGRSPRIVTCRLPKTNDPYTTLRYANKLAPYNYYAGDGPNIYSAGAISNTTAWVYENYGQILGTTQTTPFIITGFASGGNVTPANYSYMQLALGYGGAGNETICAELAH